MGCNSVIPARKPKTRHGKAFPSEPNTTNEQMLVSPLKQGTWRTLQTSPFSERFLKFMETGAVDQPGT